MLLLFEQYKAAQLFLIDDLRIGKCPSLIVCMASVHIAASNFWAGYVYMS